MEAERRFSVDDNKDMAEEESEKEKRRRKVFWWRILKNKDKRSYFASMVCKISKLSLGQMTIDWQLIDNWLINKKDQEKSWKEYFENFWKKYFQKKFQ